MATASIDLEIREEWFALDEDDDGQRHWPPEWGEPAFWTLATPTGDGFREFEFELGPADPEDSRLTDDVIAEATRLLREGFAFVGDWVEADETDGDTARLVCEVARDADAEDIHVVLDSAKAEGNGCWESAAIAWIGDADKPPMTLDGGRGAWVDWTHMGRDDDAHLFAVSDGEPHPDPFSRDLPDVIAERLRQQARQRLLDQLGVPS